MDLSIDPNATLAELQLTLFMAAITALVELAKTTDKDHIKLRALTEVARLCNPAKRKTPVDGGEAGGRGDSPRRVGSPGFAPSPTPSTPAPNPTPHGTPSASAGPQAPATSRESSSPRATGIASPRPKPVSPAPTEDLPLESLLPLNRRQRRFLARLEANERKSASPCAA